MAEDYKVKDGDCLSSIAFSKGFFWETLWNHGDNSSLKSKRKDPNVLNPGDVVHIPDLTLNEESCATEAEHKFKLKGVPAKLKIKLLRPKPAKENEESAPNPGTGAGGEDDDTSDLADPDYAPPTEEEQEPIKNAPYVLEIDGLRVDEGKTDGEGYVEIPIQPNAREGRLTVNKGEPEEQIIMLDLGAMAPVDEIAGVRKRLANLGFFCAPEGEETDDLEIALSKFQEQNSLTVTGKIDDTTKAKLKDLHGC